MEVESDSDGVQVDSAKTFSLDSLTVRSRLCYEAAYNGFMEWREQNKQTSFSENVLIAYFEEIKNKFKPSSLWTLFSQLKTIISIKNNVDLEKYTKLKDFLKNQSIGYRPKRTKTLTITQSEKFVREAPDSEYLLAKVALIMGTAGACRKHELYQMTVSNVEDLGSAVLITVPNSCKKEPRRFALTGNFYTIFKKYSDLRPPNSRYPYFFLSYMRGKCANYRMGMNKFGTMGNKIAKYLKLPNAELYTWHYFRRSSASILDADEDATSVKIHAGWKSTTVAEEIMTNKSGVASEILNALGEKIVASTSRMESQDENEDCWKETPKETLVAKQRRDASGFKARNRTVKMEAESDSDSVPVDPAKTSLNSLTVRSRVSYESAYNGFMEWREQNKHTSFSENVLITYFNEIKDKFKPTTLWTIYSQLKATISIKNNVDVEKYTKLKDLLKKQSKGYRPKKTKTLTISQSEEFIKEAPDSEYLLAKVALIMGVAGGCRKQELYHLTTSNIEDLGSAVLITVLNSYTKEPRRFALTGNFYTIFKKYADLRPPNSTEPYFFLSYAKGKCATHRMGMNKFGVMGKQIAKYLNLPNAELYTGHCFRRSSATIQNVDEDATSVKIHAGWKSTTVADEFMTNQSGIANKILSAIDSTVGASTSRMEKQDEGEVCCEEKPKGSLIAKQKKVASGFKGPSTSIISSSENETNDRPYSVSEDPLAEDMYQDEDDEDSEAEDKNFEMLDVTDSQVLQGEVEPLRVEVNNDNISSKECDLFGEYIAKHLQRLPVEMALKLQSGIQALVMQTRLEYIREHPSEAPAMVKEERSAEDSTRTSDAADNATQNGTEKRSQNTDQQQQPAAKRFKPNSSGQETTKSKSSTTHAPQNQNRRTEYTVFAEHIALQLEQLPEDVSIQLQTEIYDLITQTYSKHTDEDVPNRVKIKDEIHYVDPSELIDL